MIVGSSGRLLIGTFDVQQFFSGRRHHRRWRLGAIEEIALKHGCGLRQSMTHASRVLQTLKGDRPAVLPVKGESTESQNSGEHTNQTAIGDTMKASQQGRAACNTLGRQRTLNELEGASG